MSDTSNNETLRKKIEALQKERDQYALMLEATRSIPLAKHFEASARTIYDVCKSLIGATCGYVALLTADGSENEVLFLDDGGLPCDVDPSLPMPIRGLRAEAYHSNQVVYDNRFNTSDHMVFMPPGHLELKNVLFSPLNFGDTTVGVIGLANKPGGFTREDAHIAASFGEIAALALRHARIHESLVETDRFSKNLLRKAPIPILVINPDKTIRFVNYAFEHLSGFKQREVIGCTPPYPWWTADTLRKTQQDFNTAMEVGAACVEEKFQKKTGEVFFVEVTSAAVKTGDKLDYYLANWLDITQRKHIENSLRESEAKFRALVESSPMSIMLVQNGKYVYGNPACARLMGYDHPDDMVGMDALQPIAPEHHPRILERMKRVESGGDNFPIEIKIIKPNGDIIWSNSTSVSVTIEGVRAAIVVGQDITAQKHIEASLRQSNRKLEEANIALKVLMENWEEEKKKQALAIKHNFERLVLPFYEKLSRCQRQADREILLAIIEDNTRQSLSLLEGSIPSAYRGLTPMEIQVADLVKAGKTSKEIAEVLHTSPRSVFFHRNNLRKKFKIQHKKTSLKKVLDEMY